MLIAWMTILPLSSMRCIITTATYSLYPPCCMSLSRYDCGAEVTYQAKLGWCISYLSTHLCAVDSGVHVVRAEYHQHRRVKARVCMYSLAYGLSMFGTVLLPVEMLRSLLGSTSSPLRGVFAICVLQLTFPQMCVNARDRTASALLEKTHPTGIVTNSIIAYRSHGYRQSPH